MRRWCLGFWQTVRRHGFWPSRFCLALVVTVFELLMSSLFFVSLPLVLLALGARRARSATRSPLSSEPAAYLADAFDPQLLFLAVVLPDYCLTVLAAVIRRRPQYLLLGLGFLADAGGGRRRRALHAAARLGSTFLGEVGEPHTPGVSAESRPAKLLTA